MSTDDMIAAILRDARKYKIPINDTDDARAVGLTLRQEVLPVYANKRSRRKGIVQAEVPMNFLYVTYNCPTDAHGHIIRHGIEQIAADVEAICKKHGFAVREAPFGVWVYPSERDAPKEKKQRV